MLKFLHAFNNFGMVLRGTTLKSPGRLNKSFITVVLLDHADFDHGFLERLIPKEVGRHGGPRV